MYVLTTLDLAVCEWALCNQSKRHEALFLNQEKHFNLVLIWPPLSPLLLLIITTIKSSLTNPSEDYKIVKYLPNASQSEISHGGN